MLELLAHATAHAEVVLVRDRTRVLVVDPPALADPDAELDSERPAAPLLANALTRLVDPKLADGLPGLGRRPIRRRSVRDGDRVLARLNVALERLAPAFVVLPAPDRRTRGLEAVARSVHQLKKVAELAHLSAALPEPQTAEDLNLAGPARATADPRRERRRVSRGKHRDLECRAGAGRRGNNHQGGGLRRSLECEFTRLRGTRA